MSFISADWLRLHIAYSTWATNRLLDAAATLTSEELTRDFGTSEKSVAGTLAHIHAADRVWMGRIQGMNPTLYVDEEDRDLAVLSHQWRPTTEAVENVGRRPYRRLRARQSRLHQS